MRIALALLNLGLAIGAGALLLADYTSPPPETSRGVRFGRFYLLDDTRTIWETHGRVNQIGFHALTPVFVAAMERNSASPFRWCDVGEAFEATGDRERAEYCYRRAATLGPGDANILYAIADYYARIQDSARAVPPLAAILRLSTGDRVLTENVFAYLERVEARKNGLLEQAIPNENAGRAYLRYLIGEDDAVAASEVWTLARKRGYDDDTLTVDYTAFLLNRKQFDSAARVWSAHFADPRDGDSKSPLVFNGGFEREFTGGALDWRFEGVNGVTMQRDRLSSSEGDYSLRLEFSGNDNPDFHHLSQLVLVPPGRYRFEAQMRTDKITSDEGVRFRIQAAESKLSLSVETPALAGTNDWQQTTATFEVPPGVRMLSVQLERRRSIRIDNQLTGTVWIDAVKLTKLQ